METKIMETEKDGSPEMAHTALDAWRTAPPQGSGFDAMQVAAWLEGRLDEASAAEIECLLASDPMLLEAVLAGRDAQYGAVTPREIDAARALVQAPWWQRLVPDAGELQGRWGTAVAATVLVASVGLGAFELGESFAAVSVMQQSAAMRSMLSNDLLDTLGEK
jgi:hypothetical protein